MLSLRLRRVANRIAVLNSPNPWFSVNKGSNKHYYFLSNGFPYEVKLSLLDQNFYSLTFQLVFGFKAPDDSKESLERLQDKINGGKPFVNYEKIKREARHKAIKLVDVNKIALKRELLAKAREQWNQTQRQEWDKLPEETKASYGGDVESYLTRINPETGEEVVDEYIVYEMWNRVKKEVEEIYNKREEELYQDIYNQIISGDLSEYTENEQPWEDPSGTYSPSPQTGDARKVLSTVLDILQRDIPDWEGLNFSGDSHHAPVYMAMVRKMGSKVDLAVGDGDKNWMSFTLFKGVERMRGDMQMYFLKMLSLALKGQRTILAPKVLSPYVASIAEQFRGEATVLEVQESLQNRTQNSEVGDSSAWIA